MNATQMIDALIAIEVSADTAPDECRVIREERMALQAAIAEVGRAQHAGERLSANFPREAQAVKAEAEQAAKTHLARRMEEARRVAKMWGHTL